MNTSADSPYSVAIVGGGAAGVMAAIQILQQAQAPLRVALVEASLPLGRGIAYATTAGEHRLNVPVAKMSLFPDRPGDFLEYLLARHNPERLAAAELATSYAQRRHFGAYLRERLQQAQDVSPATLEVVGDRVVALDPSSPAVGLRLASGATLPTCAVVLAIGNSPRPMPAAGAAELPEGTCIEAWQYHDLARIPLDADVAIAGTGLSMVDAVLTLHARGHRGAIHAISRHALLPLPHATAHAHAGFDPAPLLAMSLRLRVRALRAAAADAQAGGAGWQAAMDRVRPHVQALWQSLDEADQRRFLRHVVRYWDVHRHRIAPDVHAVLGSLQARGRLRLHRARVQQVAHRGGRLQLSLQTRYATTCLQVDRLINATGVEMHPARMANPLLRQLLGSGHAAPGPHGLGVSTSADGELMDAGGQADPRVLVLGSLRTGTLWESLAVPELRVQAEAAALRLSSLDQRERDQGTAALP